MEPTPTLSKPVLRDFLKQMAEVDIPDQRNPFRLFLDAVDIERADALRLYDSTGSVFDGLDRLSMTESDFDTVLNLYILDPILIWARNE